MAQDLLKQFHLFTMDHRGHGESGHTPGNYSIVVLVEDAIGFI